MQQCVPGHLTLTPVLQVHLSFNFDLIYHGSFTRLNQKTTNLFRSYSNKMSGEWLEMDELSIDGDDMFTKRMITTTRSHHIAYLVAYSSYASSECRLACACRWSYLTY